MTYTLNDHPMIPKAQCGGITKTGARCKRRGYDVLRRGFWCPWHGDIHGPLLRPRKTPCASCPYRANVPSGVWHPEEYEKLPAYDRPTSEQPPALFHCHQQDGALCAGWVAVHGHELLALRIGVATGTVPADVFDYTTTVPLHPSGTAACAHGLAQVDNPGDRARRTIDKLTRARGLTAPSTPQ